ncbi:hypothetical protein [Humibacillus xanthopallidus]|uniref:hypothetical protein n=1 Tax=Humibacillus xanthopallidus TaxID=412689 RepID=UPI003850D659
MFWVIVLVVLVLLAGVWPLGATPRYYFHGDTQAGAFGQWYHLGTELLAGRWPVVDPQVWRAGNFIGEGQWGLFSPLTMLLGVLSVHVTNAVVFSTVVKLVLLVVGALGTYALTRSYQARPWAAALAGLTVTVGGATRYLESPSWVTGQVIWALLPVFWWAMRGITHRRRNAAAALATGMLIVSVGYVYGCLFIAIVVLACVTESVVLGHRRDAWRPVLVGVICGLLAVAVYLPGVLTAPVTVRAGFKILSDGSLPGDLLGMLIGILPFPVTASFTVWFIPLLALVQPRRAVALLRPMAGLYVFLGVIVLWLLGPNQIGPIRWPARVMPEFAMPLAVIICVLLSRAMVARVTARRVVVAAAWTIVAAYLIVSRHWIDARTIAVLAAIVLCGVLVGGVAGLTMARLGRAPNIAVGLVAMMWTFAVLASQYHFFPEPPSVDRNMPALVADYKNQVSGAVGDVIVVGDVEDALITDPSLSRDFLIASAWFVNPHSVQNTYTTIGFQNYDRRYCIRYNGTSCPELLTTLFSTHAGTGLQRVDLLSVSTIYLATSDFRPELLANPPQGWRVESSTKNAVMWVRDAPVPMAGGVVWNSRGVSVTQLSQDDRGASFQVNTTTPSGKVVLSRLAWPGYEVAGASETDMTDGYLLTIDVSRVAPGDVVTVRYSPPGWAVERAALAAALVLGAAWPIGEAIRRRRRNNAVMTAPPAGVPSQ